MEVELDDALLMAQPCEELAILAICALGWAGRHRVLPQTPGVWDSWAETLPLDLKDQVKNVWKASLRRATTGPASEQVRVVPTGAHRFDQKPLVLTLVLCDSDARLPGQPNAPAVAIDGALVSLGAQYRRPSLHFGRVLARRAAENYAPPGAVLAWAVKRFGARAHEVIQQAAQPAGRDQLAVGTGIAGSKRRHLLAAIALRELERLKEAAVIAHLDMKHGRLYKGNERNDPTIWAKLDPFQQAALEDGFGASFSDNFYSVHKALSDSSGEIAPFLSKIVERV